MTRVRPAGDEARRRIERDLHDGAQQRLVTLAVELDVPVERCLPESLEIAAYYIVSEAVTNASKHPRATRVWVDAGVEGNALRLSIRDDGVGRADPARGSGLIGLRDRVEALGGSIAVESPRGGGTRIHVAIPVPADQPIGSPRPAAGS